MSNSVHLNPYSGFAGLTFVKKGHDLCAVGVNGKAFVMDSETGELIKKFKASKGPISSLAFSCGGFCPFLCASTLFFLFDSLPLYMFQMRSLLP